MICLQKKIVVAIDGYSSCGKSSYAKLIARELGYRYLDSGAMYRAVALYALNKLWVNGTAVNADELNRHLEDIQISFKNIDGENHTFLNGVDVEKEIRGVAVASIVSEISKIKEVRARLVCLQQLMGRDKEIVMDGRDIGTVVFPDADIKIFMTADVGVRAKRRYDELLEKGMETSLEEISNNIKERDYQDIHRKVSPLVQANDAWVLDNSNMTFEEQLSWFQEILATKKLLIKGK